VIDEQEMQRRVEQREGGAFAGGGESAAFRELVAALDVGRRERAQRARRLAERQVRKMPRLERRDPIGEACSLDPVILASAAGTTDELRRRFPPTAPQVCADCFNVERGGWPMPTARSFLSLALVFVVVLSCPALADQQHIVPPAQVAAAVADRVAQQDADRASVADALERPAVREAAAHMGVDLSTIDAKIATLEGPDLARAADAARQVNDDLVGGASSVTIGTTTLIIILLLIILLIVAIK
jgi:hypothetical protein